MKLEIACSQKVVEKFNLDVYEYVLSRLSNNKFNSSLLSVSFYEEVDDENRMISTWNNRIQKL